MKVTLIDYTGKGSADPARHAANVLIFTKSTRLQMSPSLMGEIEAWPEEKVDAELQYMAATIPSSWEFCHYTFLLEGVTRAFTHQWVRSRTDSYAQQTMRVLDVSSGPGWDYLVGPTIACDPDRLSWYQESMDEAANTYTALVKDGAAIEDARGCLPTNILTNITTGCNLRSLADRLRKRASTRTQGEYREALDAIRDAIVKVHPWADLFFSQTFDNAAKELEGLLIGNLADPAVRTAAIKLLDRMRETAA
jgi:flavin-dependent thymidylate synthase